MKAQRLVLLFLTLSPSALLAQPLPPPTAVPFDTGIGFFLGAVLLWAGTRRLFGRNR